MKKITDFIVKGRYVFLVLFILLSILCLFLNKHVNINEDIMKYLPSTSETKIGYDIMNEKFSKQDSSSLNVMFKDLSDEDKLNMKKELENIKGVESVEYDSTSEYNVDNYTLYVINVDDYADSKTSSDVIKTIRKEYKVAGLSGTIEEENKALLQLWVVIVAIVCAMIILVLLSESYIEPFLYLIAIGIAVFINKGTNIFFPSVSSITDSITAILQLALSMDYSIMLSNRYKQEKLKEKNNIEAMKNALYASFKSISSSSVTTVVGLLALVFMSFTIGMDLGLVLAKGVILSLISIFFCLPALLLIFDKLITKTHKKSLHFNLTKLGRFSYKTRYFQLIAIIIVCIVAFFLKGNVNITYTGSEQDEVGKHFNSTNQIAVVYKNEYEDIISELCKDLESNENIDKVLCYSNTINEKLAYNELNNKFNELGADTEIQEYLIKLIYYDYYNQDNENKMTLNQFVNFIKNDIYNNEDLKDQIDNNTKDKIDLLTNFTNKNKINEKRTIKEIASLLNMNENDANNILIYYLSENTNTKLTINEFINFMLNDVANDPTYSSSLSKDTIDSLKQLQLFSNKDSINAKLSSKELSIIFGMDESTIEQLFLFYNITKESDIKLTINEFTTVTLNMSKNDNYKNMFNDEMIQSLTSLNNLSNNNFVNNKLDINNMNKVLNNMGININKDILTKLYIVYDGYNTDTKLTINEFASFVLYLNNYPEYKSYFNDSTINKLNTIINLYNYSNTKLDNNTLYTIFNINDITLHSNLNYIFTGNINGTYSLTELEFVSSLLSNDIVKSSLDNDTLNSLNQAYVILSNKDTKYNKEELNKLFYINSINYIYGIYDYTNELIKDISIKELITFISNTNEFDSYIKDYKSTIIFTNNIISNINTKYTVNELSSLINIDKNTVNKIYGVYEYNLNNIKLSKYEFVNLILNNKDNELLNNKLDSNSLNKLELLNKVMNSIDYKYNSKELSNLLGIDNSSTKLLFGLYNNKYIKSNNKISLKDYIGFINTNVMNNSKYSNKFDKTTKNKLSTINKVINSSLNDEKYSVKSAFSTLSVFSDSIDKDLVSVVYMYYGSSNNYKDSWNMTVEEFISYLHDNILNDSMFDDFIDTEKRDKINDAYELITKSKNLIVSDDYSRIVLNTSYKPEDKDTLEFVEELNNKLDYDGIYVVGNSNMALEMSKTFNNELNKITILTMLFIFVVVALTFKDLIIPLILVLIIQTAVYVTMSAISIGGGSSYFIALLIVQAILMGATIDYAIVYTSYYRESRLTMGVRDSIVNAYNRSIHTILSSSLILIIVTLIVANFASAIAAMICETISQGTFAAVILILFILPGVLAACDRFICRKGYYKEVKINKKKTSK